MRIDPPPGLPTSLRGAHVIFFFVPLVGCYPGLKGFFLNFWDIFEKTGSEVGRCSFPRNPEDGKPDSSPDLDETKENRLTLFSPVRRLKISNSLILSPI